ncbi:MAG TPA: ATP-binding protein [Gammaproteobacteria bacterium]|jgi:PAS domain S-box-containing protein|nr:ATP-binding protein [Gammaproteobacteria bacterium]
MKDTKTHNKMMMLYTTPIGVAATVKMSTEDRLKFLDSILASASEYSIVAYDLDLVILAWNEGACRIYHYEPEEVIGKSGLMLFDAGEIAQGHLEDILWETRTHGKWTGRLTRIRKNGQGFKADVTCTLLTDSKGVHRGYTMISQDMTEKLQLEEEVKLASDLKKTNHEFEEANRVKSHFLATMSHELRTPLNAIIGFSELLYDEKVDALTPQQKDFINDILNSAKHLLSLINDILDLSKIEAGKLDFYPSVVDVAQTIAEVCGTLREHANEKKIHINTFFSDGLDTIYIDPIRFKQILYNLLSNALKFTPEFGSIEIRFLNNSETQFRLEIEDNGIGIKTEDITKLFHEFEQLDSKQPGTGLGLALTKQIVEAQGGTIGVSSMPGNGSIFYVILPKIQEAAKMTEDSL